MAVLLSDISSSRDNNFNLIRFIAASMVIIGHSYPLTGTVGEPLHTLGISFGHVAVDIFFITSGFLVTGSLVNRKNLLAFTVARILRIYPALIVAVLFCVFVIGLYFTVQPATTYLFSPDTYMFLRNNSLLVAGPLHWYLPGVFEENIYKGAVNGSLWTLPYEIKMYAILAFLGLFVFIPSRLISKKLFTVLVVTLAFVSMVAFLVNQSLQYTESFDFIFTSRFMAMFFTGGSCYLLKNRLILSTKIFFTGLIVLVYFSDNPAIFFILYSLMVAYFVIYLAYIPSGRIRNFNRLGDYSYGLYIYAFPVQQAVAATLVGVSATMMMAVAWPVTLMLAVLSWYLIEKPILAKKDCYLIIQQYWKRIPVMFRKNEL